MTKVKKINSRNHPLTLVKSMLGDDIFEDFKKNEVFKYNSNITTNINEMKIGLQIVPRTIMSFLLQVLPGIEKGQSKEIPLPFKEGTYLHVEKKDRDVYSGYIYCDGKKETTFKFMSIPGVGLTLMSTFELYDLDKLDSAKKYESDNFNVDKLQGLIDQKLSLYNMVCQVIDNKISQRDAIDSLIKERIAQALYTKSLSENKEESLELREDEMEHKKTYKPTKLKGFLDKKKKEREQKKDDVEIQKSENITCPNCASTLYDGGNKMTLCICYGESWNQDIKITKSESKVKLKFPKNIDKENVEMLLQVIRNKQK